MNQIEGAPKATLVQDDRPNTYPSSWNVVFAPAAPLPADYVFGPQSTILKQGSVFPPAAMPLPCDIRWDRDVPVTLRDGVTIYTDILRPVGSCYRYSKNPQIRRLKIPQV